MSDSESDGEGRASVVYDLLSPEERERQRREREESRRVLSELKAVLGLRASEGERRKWKQLLFNEQGLFSISLARSAPPHTHLLLSVRKQHSHITSLFLSYSHCLSLLSNPLSFYSPPLPTTPPPLSRLEALAQRGVPRTWER